MKAEEMQRRLVCPATNTQGQPGSSWDNSAPAHPGTDHTATCKYIDESRENEQKAGQPAAGSSWEKRAPARAYRYCPNHHLQIQYCT
jgi:hypothetical protein